MIKDSERGNKYVSVQLEELMQLGQRAKELSMTTTNLKRRAVGPQPSRIQGRGMEFAESRLYRAGDDVRSIDWRLTARTGKPHTKLFTEERERQVLLCVDMRAPMFFATQGVFKSVQAATIAAYIAWNASLTGSRVGGLIFDDSGVEELRPRLGKKGLLPLLQAFSTKGAFPRPSVDKIRYTIDEAIGSLTNVAPSGALIFLISDFRRISPPALEQINQLSAHADVSLCMIYDPLEAELPSGKFLPITDGKQNKCLNALDAPGRQEYLLRYQNREQILQGPMQRHHFMKCSTAEDGFLCLRQHFHA